MSLAGAGTLLEGPASAANAPAPTSVATRATRPPPAEMTSPFNRQLGGEPGHDRRHQLWVEQRRQVAEDVTAIAVRAIGDRFSLMP